MYRAMPSRGDVLKKRPVSVIWNLKVLKSKACPQFATLAAEGNLYK
jgi:hypothetical protein